ncbi:hypothetical protein [Acetobacter sp. DsW_063]|uniref:hypothetical protein n=1 Tax=Acetobacter sp. DsW_063 TaxID=1514894 RepID=UPI001302C9E8|nr:hypothetical protein [Acetobacter sp. DsW_063]
MAKSINILFQSFETSSARCNNSAMTAALLVDDSGALLHKETGTPFIPRADTKFNVAHTKSRAEANIALGNYTQAYSLSDTMPDTQNLKVLPGGSRQDATGTILPRTKSMESLSPQERTEYLGQDTDTDQSRRAQNAAMHVVATLYQFRADLLILAEVGFAEAAAIITMSKTLDNAKTFKRGSDRQRKKKHDGIDASFFNGSEVQSITQPSRAQSFSFCAAQKSLGDINIPQSQSGETEVGFACIEFKNLVIAAVHTPNESQQKAIIYERILKFSEDNFGKPCDIIVGDTNVHSAVFTKNEGGSPTAKIRNAVSKFFQRADVKSDEPNYVEPVRKTMQEKLLSGEKKIKLSSIKNLEKRELNKKRGIAMDIVTMRKNPTYKNASIDLTSTNSTLNKHIDYLFYNENTIESVSVKHVDALTSGYPGTDHSGLAVTITPKN